VPPPLPLAEVLAQSIDPRSAELATQTLFGLWDVAFEPDDERGACNAALDAGLRCLILPGASLADLRQVDRPAVLELTDASGNRHAAVLRRLGRDSADLEIGGKRFAVSIADLTHAWYGDHWLLWQPATDVGSDLAPGMRSDRVVWLREALAHYLGESVETAGADRNLFDETLAEQVRQFQSARHLDVDGVLGSQTQIVLQADIGHGSGPTLHGEG
jgi:general secretion pathway protein A